YFYCLRLLTKGWIEPQKARLLVWYESIQARKGGLSFRPFLESILRSAGDIFTADDWPWILARAGDFPTATAVLLRGLAVEKSPSMGALSQSFDRLDQGGASAGVSELKGAIATALSESNSAEALAALRKI